MNFNAAKDVVFIEALVTFHERREEAIDLPIPSKLLQSLRQQGGLVIGTEMFTVLEDMGSAEEIKQQLSSNHERVAQLHLWVEGMLDRQDGWALGTRKKNVRKVKKWVAEAERLSEDSAGLVKQLEVIEGVYA